MDNAGDYAGYSGGRWKEKNMLIIVDHLPTFPPHRSGIFGKKK